MLAAGASALAAPAALGQASPRLVVVGGGFAGVAAARALRRDRPAAEVVLIEPERQFTACPFSNAVVAGLRDLSQQSFGYDALARERLSLVHAAVAAIDADARELRLEDGTTLGYDRLVMAAGIDLAFDALPGYDRAASSILPHAWKAGEQTLLLRRQIEALPDGGTVLMAVPANPYRCPPGPYERASLIAHFIKTRRPRSKLLILDAKDAFSKQSLFEAVWRDLYPGIVEWVPLSAGGRVVEVDTAARQLVTEFGRHGGDVVTVIPPQRAAAIALSAGIADRTGWCPIDPVTFESRLRPGIHVVGDAAIAGAMPKSAFSANGQAKACAAAISALLDEREPAPPKLINTCYSLVAPDEAISIAGVYEPRDGLLREVDGAGGISPAQGGVALRRAEAVFAESWFATITMETFG